MHYTGTIWRPPYEAMSLLLEVAAGCTHHGCKFCTLYEDLPFKFKMTSREDIEADLKEVSEDTERVFLTGANPFVFKFDRLMDIAGSIHKYIPRCKSIGCFSRVTDVCNKTEEELKALHDAGFNGLTIGIETGDDEALKFMNKGYKASDIVIQCKRLDQAGIRYRFFYLAGISGAGRGVIGAKATAEVCNQLHPTGIGVNMLTIYPSSELYQEIVTGKWKEEGEVEKYKEILTLIKYLEIPTVFEALGASNAVQLQGVLPRDENKLLSTIGHIIENVSEHELQHYRKGVYHL